MLAKNRMCQARQVHTISSVHTLLIHTFSLPSTPLTLSSSTPSHQHRRAGFLQKRSSFWAVGYVVALDVGPQTCECDTADDGLVGFAGAVTPAVVVVKTTARVSKQELADEAIYTYPAVNISIRCCSVVPGSSLFLRPEKIPSCLSKASPAARLTSIISG
jgi:hypothetical protein